MNLRRNTAQINASPHARAHTHTRIHTHTHTHTHIYIYIYFIKSKMWRKEFLNGIRLVGTQNFPSRWLVALPTLINRAYPTIHSHLWRRKKDGFLSFLWASTWSETPTAESHIWTRATNSISHDDNRYAKHASKVNM